jgi:hypothetical protein
LEKRIDTSSSDKELYRFGAMAIFRGYATLGQIQQALAEQVMENVNGKSHRPLGTILREKGWITEEQEEAILKEMLGEGV